MHFGTEYSRGSEVRAHNTNIKNIIFGPNIARIEGSERTIRILKTALLGPIMEGVGWSERTIRLLQNAFWTDYMMGSGV